MESLINKFNNTFYPPNYKQTSAHFTSKISNIVADEVSDCIGLDFGNSNICVSYYKNQLFHAFQLGPQSCIMPAWLTLKEKEFFIGTAAKSTQHQKSTKLTIFDIRRALSSHPISSVGLPFNFTKEMNFEKNGVTIPLVRVIAILMSAIKDKIETTLKEPIKSVVLTIPTSFNIKQQQILVDACRIANLKVMKLLFEPVATAITYYSMKKSEKKIICVIDFGGGKLDVANFVIEDGTIAISNHATDLQLGGRDFDEKLVNRVLAVLKQKLPLINVNDRILTTIREKCIAVKESLTICSQKNIEIEIGDDDITLNITKVDFENLCDDLFKRASTLIKSVANKNDRNQFSDVVLVGGSSRIPKFQDDVQQIFQNIPFNVTINADEGIAKGACMYGALKSGLIKKFKIEDNIPFTGRSLTNPKMKTIVDNNGIVQHKIVESSVKHCTDIKNEQNEISKMFEKHVEAAKQDHAKIIKPEDNTSAIIEKYLNPDFAILYEQKGYNIMALQALKHYLQQNLDQNTRDLVVSWCVKRIDICTNAIHLYHEWVPGRYSHCDMLDQEIKKLCLNSATMDPNALETHLQYLNYVRFSLEKRYEIYPFWNVSFTEPCKSLLEQIKRELGLLLNLLDNFHQTNQRVVYDLQLLTDLLNSFFTYNKRS